MSWETDDEVRGKYRVIKRKIKIHTVRFSICLKEMDESRIYQIFPAERSVMLLCEMSGIQKNSRLGKYQICNGIKRDMKK